MPDFVSMPWGELLRPEGFDCTCGRHHATGLQLLWLEPGCVDILPGTLSRLGVRMPLLVCDVNTYAVAGQQAAQALRTAGMPFVMHRFPQAEPMLPDEKALDTLRAALLPDCNFILGIGSGVINDLCKALGHERELRTGILATAPSMDGYASDSASLEIRGVKTTLPCACPTVVLGDPQVLADAPQRMRQSGLGDMLAKYISLTEWRMSHLVTDETFCPDVAAMTRASLRKAIAAAPGYLRAEQAATREMTEGLVLSGVASAFAGMSRPASGLEHTFSHLWDMSALAQNKPPQPHGLQVAVGTVLAMVEWDWIRGQRPTMEAAQAAIEAFDDAAWQADMRRVFGPAARELIGLSHAEGRNSPDHRLARAEQAVRHWPKILQCAGEELPDFEALAALMREAGLPTHPAQLGIGNQQALDAFTHSRDLRSRYLSSSLLFDLGLLESCRQHLAEWLERKTPEL